MIKKLSTLISKNKLYLTSAVLLVVLVVPTGLAFAAPLAQSTPTLNIDFSSMIQLVFDNAALIVTALMGVAAIGIGFRFGGRILEWVGDMLGNALKF